MFKVSSLSSVICLAGLVSAFIAMEVMVSVLGVRLLVCDGSV